MLQRNGIVAEVTIAQNEGTRVVKSTGNGRFDAVSNAFKQYFDISYELISIRRAFIIKRFII